MMDPDTKVKVVQNVQTFFLDFLQNFRLRGEDGTLQPEPYYVEQAKAMVREKRHTLYVEIQHIEQVDPSAVTFDPPVLRSAIESKYMMLRDALNVVVPDFISKIEDKDIEDEARAEVAKNELKYAVAFHDLPLFSGIRDLRTEKLGRLISICGTVTRTTEIKPELLVGTFQCNECNREVAGVVQQFKITEPSSCPTRNCGNRTSWTSLPKATTTRWGEWQRLRLQENENEVPAGSMPRSMDVIVRDDNCERCKPGDKVLITGSLIVVPDVPSMMNPAELKSQVRRDLQSRSDASYGAGDGVRGLKGMGQRDLTYKMAFFGIFIEEHSDLGSKSKKNGGENVRSDDKVYLSQADKDKFHSISEHQGPGGKKDCFDIVARAVAPSIHGHLEVKKGILLMLIGAMPKRTDEGIKLRGDINVCLLGDPATAKSAMLKWVSKFLPRAVFASGKTSTAAGLTASVVRDTELDGERVIQPGALMLADNGICCIDEFELMDKKDQVAIHEAMEQQTITLSKAGIQATLNARASILASCLPKNMYYEPTQPLHKNCELTPPIMSRFDLMFVMQDVHDESNDNTVAWHIVQQHRQRGGSSTSKGEFELSKLELQRYIRFARSLRPKITPEAKQRLVKCYKKLREDRTFVRGSAGVTVRQLESLIRLSEAIARVHLDDKITVDYVAQAFDLQLNTLKRADRENIDLEEPDMGGQAAPAAAEPAADVAGAEGAVADAAPARAKRVRITYAEYQRIGNMLIKHLADEKDKNVEVREEDLVAWYMEQIEDDIQTEVQLREQQDLVQRLIMRMIDKDRVIVVERPSEDALRPEGRVLGKHPNVPVGEPISR